MLALIDQINNSIRRNVFWW